MKTSELSGAALDWAVTKIEAERQRFLVYPLYITKYSSDWAQGGPIIEREKLSFVAPHDDIQCWEAVHPQHPHDEKYGETPLIAAMRCYVASKLGAEIEIPNELTGGDSK